MKAIVYLQYGSPDVLQLKDIEKPVPAPDEVLIKVYAASVNAGDLHLLRAEPFLVRLSSGFLKPKNTILGADIAGRVEAMGKPRQCPWRPSLLCRVSATMDRSSQGKKF